MKKHYFIFMILITISAVLPLNSKVLVVKWKNADFYNEALNGFIKSGIADYEVSDCNGSKDEAEKILSDANRYDAVFVLGEGSLKAAVKAKLSKPVVYGMVYNPILITQGSTNITGVSLNISFNSQINIIKEILPNIKNIGILYSKIELINGMDSIASESGLKLRTVKVESESDISKKLKELKNENLIIMLSDPILSTSGIISSILLFGIESKIPLFVTSDKLVKSGALFGLAPDYFENGKSAGLLMKKILDSQKISEPEEMSKSALYINLKTAKDLSIKIGNETVKKSKEVYK